MASRVVAVSFGPREHTRVSCTKYIERRIIRAWKAITSQRNRRHNRASLLPEDFVMLTQRCRSVRFN
ncbi:hypothetical protein C8Q77DRAFT_1220290 [Trametes polyzona]|nr:hypothetical protein C8Q77DRAFT_1220290 [Trametes polyzona]